MIKTFENRADAEAALSAKGYKPFPSGRYCTAHFVAMIHPIPGKTAVRVSYAPKNNA